MMGRTNPTYRNYLQQFEERCSPFRRALRRQYKPAFDEVFEHAQQHSDAAGYLNSRNPELAVLLSILIGQQHELREIREAVEE
jgi:hypothetical protein